MGSDDQVIVLGGEDVAPPEPAGSRRSPLPFLLVGALFVGLIAFVLAPEDVGPTGVESTGLGAPPEPPRASVEPDGAGAPAAVPDLALGWKAVAMVGDGWVVSDVAHGPSGWLAVSAGIPAVVHTSADAVVWEAASLAEVSGSDPQVAVGDGVMAVAAVGDVDSSVFAAVSEDGGETWAETLVDGRSGVVHGVSVIGPEVYIFGEVLDQAVQVEGAWAPVVWRLDDQGWVALEDPGASDGIVTGVLRAGDGSMRGFGRRDGAAASWVLDGALQPVAVEVPPALGSFVEVGHAGDGGFFAVGGNIMTGTGHAVWRSDDLTTWESDGTGSPLREVIVHGGQVVGVHSDQVGMVVVGSDGHSFISNRYPGITTGWEGFGYLAALATDGETVVLGGVDEAGRPALALRGTAVQATSLPAAAEVTWSSVAGAPVSEWGFHRPAVVATGDATFVLAAGLMWQVDGVDSSGPTIRPVVIDGDPVRAWQLGRVGEVTWAFDGDGHRLLTRGVDGAWVSASIPLEWVGVVFERDDGLVALGDAEGSSGLVARLTLDGGWALLEDADPSVYPVATAAGVVFGVSDEGTGSVTPVVSSDGVGWETLVLDGEPGLALRGAGGLPFLHDRGEPATVWLLDGWPDVEQVELPTSSPWSIERSGDELWVAGPGALWIRRADLAWEKLPTGVQNGVTGSPGFVPGEVPTLVVSSGGRVDLLRIAE